MTLLTRPVLSRNESMQKYMLLSAQKEALQRRMSLQLPSDAPMTASSPEFQSLSSSPTESLKFTSPFPVTSEPVPMRSGISSHHTTDDLHLEESQKLCEINQQIVATLTELLNTDSVRSDGKQRAWIQERLMEAEHQSRRQRRRHGSNAERDFASSIAQHLELSLTTSKTWT